jgi:hypothetical protein
MNAIWHVAHQHIGHAYIMQALDPVLQQLGMWLLVRDRFNTRS